MNTQTQDQKQQLKTIKQVNEVQGEEKNSFRCSHPPKISHYLCECMFELLVEY